MFLGYVCSNSMQPQLNDLRMQEEYMVYLRGETCDFEHYLTGHYLGERTEHNARRLWQPHSGLYNAVAYNQQRR